MIGELTRTKASVYILPMFEQNREYFAYTTDLMNVYMFEESYPGIEGYIYLLYRINEIEFEASQIGMRLKKHDQFIATYGIFIGKGFTMVVMELSQNYVYDIKKFWSGKFSEFTEFYKMSILDFHGAINDSLLHGILGKLPKVKKNLERRITGIGAKVQIPNGMDLDSKPIMTTETFFSKNLRKFEKEKKVETFVPRTKTHRTNS